MSSTSKLRRVACLTAVVAAVPAGSAVAMPAPESHAPQNDSPGGWALSERASEPTPAPRSQAAPAGSSRGWALSERALDPRPAPSAPLDSTRVTVDDGGGVDWPSIGLVAGIVALMGLGAAGGVAGMRRRHRPAAF